MTSVPVVSSALRPEHPVGEVNSVTIQPSVAFGKAKRTNAERLA